MTSLFVPVYHQARWHKTISRSTCSSGIPKCALDNPSLGPNTIPAMLDGKPAQASINQKLILPPLHVINATNGLELMPILEPIFESRNFNFVYSRMQSTLCEQGLFDRILQELDHNILMHLAIGHDVFVYDVASRNKKRGVPRSIWYGIPFIKYALVYLWFGRDSEHVPQRVMLRGQNVAEPWSKVCTFLEKSTKKRIRYYKYYADTMGVRSVGLFGVTNGVARNDGKYEYYAALVRDYYLLRFGSTSSSDALRQRLRPEANTCNYNMGEWREYLGSIGFEVYDSERTLEGYGEDED